ncbi:unnamed protein product [Ilex paraguariensis]|uniref:Uncharacterized protein n=1 Tax=Ilex paraguariensis TaxID=185542 RepID=A0ABC8UTN2_9AQUA
MTTSNSSLSSKGPGIKCFHLHEPKKKEAPKDTVGRLAKRALKHEVAGKTAAAKHQQHSAEWLFTAPAMSLNLKLDHCTMLGIDLQNYLDRCGCRKF